ncbi:hypothetical protein WN55_03322 [Dufourea novaeangliae]|uniref:Uncharacterized protein n=1 Tax=Dufourea novaeangliae TaxID=178035 RepID=A0A154PL26_DUFNO|nr:hypothetical protein WN55_03322 [Dufourea novaeangliae]
MEKKGRRFLHAPDISMHSLTPPFHNPLMLLDSVDNHLLFAEMRPEKVERREPAMLPVEWGSIPILHEYQMAMIIGFSFPVSSTSCLFLALDRESRSGEILCARGRNEGDQLVMGPRTHKSELFVGVNCSVTFFYRSFNAFLGSNSVGTVRDFCQEFKQGSTV